MTINIEQIKSALEESEKAIPITSFCVSRKVMDELENFTVENPPSGMMLWSYPVLIDENLPDPPGYYMLDKNGNAYVPTKNGIIKVPINPFLSLRSR